MVMYEGFGEYINNSMYLSVMLVLVSRYLDRFSYPLVALRTAPDTPVRPLNNLPMLFEVTQTFIKFGLILAIMDYAKMLDDGWKNLPEDVTSSGERFEVPKAKGHVQGNKTVITNFNQIVGDLRRDSQHFLKFLLKEIAAPGHMVGNRLVVNRKVSPSLLNTKILKYAEEYVFCECGKPDTMIIKKEGKTFLKCMACGKQREIKL